MRTTRRTPLFILGLFAIAVPWLACVGEDVQSNGDAAGSEGGPCLANGGCDNGITCVSHRCVRLDAGQASSSGGDPGHDAGFDATSAVGCDAAITPAPIPTNIRCGDAGSYGCFAGGNVCCVDKTCNTNGDACPSQQYWQCDGPGYCAGRRCCVNELELGPESQCPRQGTVSSGGVQTRCADTCGDSPSFLCKTADDCDGGTCAPVEVQPVGYTEKIIVGMCQK